MQLEKKDCSTLQNKYIVSSVSVSCHNPDSYRHQREGQNIWIVCCFIRKTCATTLNRAVLLNPVPWEFVCYKSHVHWEVIMEWKTSHHRRLSCMEHWKFHRIKTPLELPWAMTGGSWSINTQLPHPLQDITLKCMFYTGSQSFPNAVKLQLLSVVTYR